MREDKAPKSKNYRERTYKNGEIFYFFGKAYPLIVAPQSGQAPSLELSGGYFKLTSNEPSSAFPLFLAWYTRETSLFLRGILPDWARRLSVRPRSVRVRFATSRWGSCGIRGDLSFNSRLGVLDSELIEYVAVHELCHLKQMNHSAAFWAEVASALPSWPALRQRLKEQTAQALF